MRASGNQAPLPTRAGEDLAMRIKDALRRCGRKMLNELAGSSALLRRVLAVGASAFGEQIDPAIDGIVASGLSGDHCHVLRHGRCSVSEPRPPVGSFPWVRPFPPRPPLRVASLCSVASSVVRPHPTSHPRACSRLLPSRAGPANFRAWMRPLRFRAKNYKVSDCARFIPWGHWAASTPVTPVGGLRACSQRKIAVA
jgi:hypothetical protein